MSASSDGEPVTAADSTRVGITVLSLFSVAWAVVLFPLSSASAPVALIAAVITALWAASLLLVSRRRDFADAEAAAASDLSAAQRRRIFIVTNVAQAAVFSVAISICIATERVEVIPLIAALVVGVHFVPLARAFGEPSFGWAGALLTVLGGGGLLLAAVGATSPEAAVTITAVGASLTLLITATALLRRHGHQGSRGAHRLSTS